MPILALQFRGKAQSPDGTEVEVPADVALGERGPIVQVTIAVADPIAALFVQRGLPIPPPVAGQALIDTGASTTCIDEDVARQLGLPVVNVIQMSSASHASHPANVYPAKIKMSGLPLEFDIPLAIGASLVAQGLVALIGRDILANCQLVYSGSIGQITLAV